MFSIKDKLPAENETVSCLVNIWYYGRLHGTETVKGTFLGMNTITNKPLFDFDDKDNEAYFEVTHWELREQTISALA